MSMPVTKYILVSKNIFPLILFTFNSVSVNLIILNLCTLLKSIWKWLFFYYRWGCISSPSNLFSSFMKETASILVSAKVYTRGVWVFLEMGTWLTFAVFQFF